MGIRTTFEHYFAGYVELNIACETLFANLRIPSVWYRQKNCLVTGNEKFNAHYSKKVSKDIEEICIRIPLLTEKVWLRTSD